MATITIRKLDDALKSKLRVRAKIHGRSMEEEVREILSTALSDGPVRKDLGTAIRELFEPLGGVDLKFPPRKGIRPPPDFS